MSRRVERLATAADLDGVLAIEQTSFNNPTTREWYEGELKRPDVCFIYVMRTADAPVAAFCAFWLVADQAHINNLAVQPDLRGRGLGLHLINTTIVEAARLGASELTLEVRSSNEPALRLYARAGFEKAGIRKNYYTSPIEDAFVLIRKLTETGRREPGTT